MPRKNKINNLHQTHGRVDNPVTLDQVWGETGNQKYGTLDVNEYTKYLEDLNRSDLQDHAVKMGLVPIDNRETLTARLIKEFQKHIAHFNVMKNIKTQKTSDLSKEVRDILSEGK